MVGSCRFGNAKGWCITNPGNDLGADRAMTWGKSYAFLKETKKLHLFKRKKKSCVFLKFCVITSQKRKFWTDIESWDRHIWCRSNIKFSTPSLTASIYKRECGRGMPKSHNLYFIGLDCLDKLPNIFDISSPKWTILAIIGHCMVY